MKYLLSLLALATLGVVTAGCAQPTLEDRVQDYIAGTGQSYEACGTLTLGNTCTEVPDPAISCFVEGFAACKPVRVDFTQYTVEGDPIYVTYLVVPEGKTCHVETFVDTREDAFGPKEILQQSCNTVVGNGTCAAPLTVDECSSACSSGADCG